MTPVSPEEFERLLAALDREALTAFVADLWAERGWETAATDGVVVARHPTTDEVRRFAVAHRRFRRWQIPNAPADAVVVPHLEGDVDPGVPSIDVEDLRAVLLYGVDRAAGDRLCRTHFDRPIDGVAPATRSVSPTRVLTVSLLIVVILAGVLLYPPGQVPSDTPTEKPSAVPGGDVTPTSTPPQTTERGLPLGLNERGVADAGALAQAHGEAAAGASYRLRIEHDGTQSVQFDRRWLEARETVLVANRSTYLHVARGVLDTGSDPASVEVVTYADGAYEYTRASRGDEVEFSRRSIQITAGGENAVTDRVEGYVARYLATNQSRYAYIGFDDPNAYYRIVATGEPARISGNVTDYIARTVIDRDGFVWYLDVSYTVTEDGESARVSLTIDYSEASGPPASPPWYPDLRDATAADDVEPAEENLPEPALEPSYAQSATNSTTSSSSARLMPWPAS